MAEEKKKITRVMRVTMDEDEFDKYDRGETHSNSGLRNKTGRLSALPDIAPIEEEDLPQREIVVYQDRYFEPERPTVGQRIAKGAVNVVHDVLSDPEVQESLYMFASMLWHYKVKLGIKKTIRKIKGEDKLKVKDKKTVVVEQNKFNTAVTQRETTEIEEYVPSMDSGEIFVVNEEQAEQILAEAGRKARELSAMIYLLSNLCIKDEKSKEEYIIEQSYIKRLLSDEATNTMRLLTKNGKLHLIDDETALLFTDFLNGYVRNGEQLILIPVHVQSDC